MQLIESDVPTSQTKGKGEGDLTKLNQLNVFEVEDFHNKLDDSRCKVASLIGWMKPEK